MKNMYVCMGNAKATDTAAWVSQAKLALTTSTTDSINPRPNTAAAVMTTRRTSQDQGRSTRAKSATGDSQNFVANDNENDSGVWTPNGAVPHGDVGSAGAESIQMKDGEVKKARFDDVQEVIPNRLPDSDSRPVGLRPSDLKCLIDESARFDTGSGLVCAVSPRDLKRDDIADKKHNQAQTTEMTFTSVDEFGGAIVAMALKHAIAEVSGTELSDAENNNEVRRLVAQPSHLKLTKELLDNIDVAVVTENRETQLAVQSSESEKSDNEQEVKSPKDEKPLIALGKDDKESDADSVLNSDDDYDEDRDVFFRKNKKNQKFALTNRKGLEQFCRFLGGTVGEKQWNLWLDVERAKTIESSRELAR